MLNRITLIGRLTRDPELRYTHGGVAVASFTLAVDRMHKDANGEKETDFVPVVVWKKQAENCAQYLQKGRLAAVDGRLQIRSYENREGQKVRVAEVVANLVRFLEHGERREENSKPAAVTQRENQEQSKPTPSRYKSQPHSSRYQDDPFADDVVVDISDDDLPF